MSTATYVLNGKRVSREQFDKATPSKFAQLLEGGEVGTQSTGWPLHSNALAVHPSQIGEAVESANRKGVPTEFDAKGRPILRDRAHRKAYSRAYGFHDNDGGYGDP